MTCFHHKLLLQEGKLKSPHMVAKLYIIKRPSKTKMCQTCKTNPKEHHHAQKITTTRRLLIKLLCIVPMLLLIQKLHFRFR
uniref:Uncharacterized protein n=1 Tax=Rhizophora mucronata TaxID=61149 RepID=A0A2P2NFK8_RHIMU